MCEWSKVENKAVRGGERHVYVGLSGYICFYEHVRVSRVQLKPECHGRKCIYAQSVGLKERSSHPEVAISRLCYCPLLIPTKNLLSVTQFCRSCYKYALFTLLLSSSPISVPLYYSGSGLAQLTARTILFHLSVSHPLICRQCA